MDDGGGVVRGRRRLVHRGDTTDLETYTEAAIEGLHIAGGYESRVGTKYRVGTKEGCVRNTGATYTGWVPIVGTQYTSTAWVRNPDFIKMRVSGHSHILIYG